MDGQSSVADALKIFLTAISIHLSIIHALAKYCSWVKRCNQIHTRTRTQYQYVIIFVCNVYQHQNIYRVQILGAPSTLGSLHGRGPPLTISCDATANIRVPQIVRETDLQTVKPVTQKKLTKLTTTLCLFSWGSFSFFFVYF